MKRTKTRKPVRRAQVSRRVPKSQIVKHKLMISSRILMWLSILIVPIATGVFTYRWIQNPENLTIKSVEVTGDLKILDKKQLQPLIEEYAKTNLFLLDDKSLEEKIEKNPWVYSASMTHVWPDKLIVRIYEQNPVAFWGDDAMLAENGEIIKASLDEKKGTLPVLFSPENKGRNMANGFLKIREMMQEFPVKLVEFKEDARGSWQIKLENGITLKIGRSEQQKRLKRFVVGYKHGLKGQLDKIQSVDLRYPNGFAVKWKKGLSADSVNKG